MIFVKAKKGESTESVIRRFKKLVVLEGIVEGIRDRAEYRKPSTIKQLRIKEKWRKIHRSKKYDK